MIGRSEQPSQVGPLDEEGQDEVRGVDHERQRQPRLGEHGRPDGRGRGGCPVRASPKPKTTVPWAWSQSRARVVAARLGAWRAAPESEGQQQAGQDEPDGEGDVAAEDDGEEAGHGPMPGRTSSTPVGSAGAIASVDAFRLQGHPVAFGVAASDVEADRGQGAADLRLPVDVDAAREEPAARVSSPRGARRPGGRGGPR